MPSHPPRGSPTRDNGCRAPREKAGPPERPPGHTAVSAPPPAACGTEDGQPACPPGPHPRSPRCRLAAPPGRGGSPRLPAAASALGVGGRTGRDATREGAETAAAPRPSAKGRRGGATGPSPPPPPHRAAARPPPRRLPAPRRPC